MGWRSWNCFHGEVNDSAIRATIDAITDRSRTVDGKPTSLADLGFDSVGIDDGWQVSLHTPIVRNGTLTWQVSLHGGN
jgi:hypothetical protein